MSPSYMQEIASSGPLHEPSWVGTLEEMLQMRQMERLPALHLAVVTLLGFCCLIHASRAATSFPTAALRAQLQETEAILASSGADDQAVVAGDVDRGAVSRRMEMEMELEDYPGSGPNDHHSPWWRQERRN
ncbi:hypothetical protein D1007_50908 [Hordeum vulgare]|nr:hypothetical protein D1007_50908 [Hordeum vulgare]